jgi:hypothetical protein
MFAIAGMTEAKVAVWSTAKIATGGGMTRVLMCRWEWCVCEIIHNKGLVRVNG